jgi:hypothetical protein
MDLITACMSEDREAVYQILNRNLDFQDKDGVTAESRPGRIQNIHQAN